MSTAEMPVPNTNELPGDAEPHWLESRLEAIVLRRLGHSASRAFWMLGDQGIASLGNMLTMWVVGRHFAGDYKWEYGAYGILFDTMMFLNSLQAALVTYPLTIQGASGNRGSLRRSATAALTFTLALLPLLGLGMGFGAIRAGWHGGAELGGSSGKALLAITAAGAMLLWQLQETVRRGLISEFRIAACIPGDIISYLVQAGLVYLLHRMNRLNLVTIFMVLGGTSLVAMILQSIQIGVSRISFRDMGTLAAEWWKLGKWAMLTNLSMFVTGISFSWVLEFWHNADLTTFTAINLPVKVTYPVIASISGLIVPAVARAASKYDWKQTRRSALRYAALGAMVVGPIFAFVASAPHLCLHILYKQYDSPSTAMLLRLWVINCVVSYVATILGNWLSGLKEPRYQFLAQIIHMVSVVLISLPATWKWGLPGLILGGIGTTTIDMLALFFFLYKADRHLSSTVPPAAEPAPA